MSRLVNIIGICGKARSGKDTFARFLADSLGNQYGKSVAIMSMAETMKDMLWPLLRVFAPAHLHPTDFVLRCLAGDLKEEEIEGIGTSPRVLMQTLGTEWGRNIIGENLWISAMNRRIAEYALEDVPWDDSEEMEEVFVIIPDIRYDNEAECLPTNLVKIVRPNVEEVNAHTSEEGISEDWIDIIIYNDDDLDQLAGAAQVVAEELVRDVG